MYFHFNVERDIKEIQFTSYKAPDGKYERHVDRAFKGKVRKLSVTVQLSNSKDYTGGELCLYEDNKPIIMNKSQGYLIVFPSFIMHQVKQVTQGERCSLVCWMGGNQFT